MTSRASRLLPLLGVVALAVVLRPPVAAVGPLLPAIENSLGLSAFASSILTAIPVVCFGLGSFFAPRLVARTGLESGVVALSALLLVGILVRVHGDIPTMFVGSALIGTAIALGNTLLPALIKQDFPERIGIMTGTYTTVMVSFAALSAAVAVPLAGADGTDWQTSFLWWAIPAALAVVVWLPQLRHHAARKQEQNSTRISVWKSGPAWSLALFMGFQSISFYAVLSWLPSLLQDAGIDATTAGALLGFSSFVAIPMGLFLPPVIRRPHLLQPTAVAISIVALIGTAGLTFAPTNGTIAWLILLGIGQGTAFPLALNLITIRSASRDITTSVSAMAQGVGYLMAAAGTYIVGALNALTNAWTIPMLAMCAFATMQIVLSWQAASSRLIESINHG